MFTGNLEALLAQVNPALQQELRKELREHSRMEAIETVKCRYDPKRYRPYSGARAANAELLGLTPIGRGSAFASLVAVHPQFPDMVVKVVDWDDAGAWYLRACKDGVIKGPHAPVVYAVHRMGTQAFIYMERLIDVNDMPENMDDYVRDVNEFCRRSTGAATIDSTIVTWKMQFKQWNLHPERDYNMFSTDFHSGNCMFRADGTLVFIDPVHGARDTESMAIEKQAKRDKVLAERKAREEYREARIKVEGIKPRHPAMVAFFGDIVDEHIMAMPVMKHISYFCPISRERRRRAIMPKIAMDHRADKGMFIRRDKTVPNICNGAPHAAILQRNHNIKGFKK